ncbi:RES domain-containing protein [Actinomyces ruminicola]|uniref:RES domain-containing protein n=1 Tax=Actinomyces ruminicola TaxID=332524 RepID=UPI003CCBBE52
MERTRFFPFRPPSPPECRRSAQTHASPRYASHQSLKSCGSLRRLNRPDLRLCRSRTFLTYASTNTPIRDDTPAEVTACVAAGGGPLQGGLRRGPLLPGAVVSRPAVLCEPTGPLYRIGRAEAPFHFSEITLEISGLPNTGNRFDVLGGGVMYAASTPTGAFVETLQSFRPTTAARVAVACDTPGFMALSVWGCGGGLSG